MTFVITVTAPSNWVGIFAYIVINIQALNYEPIQTTTSYYQRDPAIYGLSGKEADAYSTA